MHILHIIGSLDPASGGPAAAALRLAAAQAELGHEVGIVAPREPDAERRLEGAIARVPGRGRIRRISPPGAERFFRLEPLLRRSAWNAIAAEADILHLHGVWEPMLLAAAAAARRAGKPYVLEPHGMLDRWSLGEKASKKRIALALGFRRMIRRAAYIHALNDDEVRLMGVVGASPSPPRLVIPNGVFMEEIEPLPSEGTFRRMHPALSGRRYVLFLSRLHSKKGLDHLLGAFRRIAPLHPEVDLVVAGPDGGEEERFRRDVATAGLVPRVHLVGALWGADKIAAFVDAACFCLPSRQEGFSMAITEALACGTPVVISRECRFPEVATEGAGEVLPLDPDAFADALDGLLSSPVRAARMGRAGRALVKAAYTWPVIARRTVAAYRMFVTDRTAGGRAEVVRLHRLAGSGDARA
jgi:glycosyltransferase involved in cell wall biosynthesis